MTARAWPPFAFSAVPSLDMAATVAMAVRGAISTSIGKIDGACDLTTVCSVGGFQPQIRGLGGPDNAHEGMLIPRVGGGFHILVDPRPMHQHLENDVLIRHRSRFRIAHEIGHSFFYDRSCNPPRRLTPETPREEQFCDAFASALLVPPSVVKSLSPTIKTVLKVYADFDVSIEVASRALASVYRDIYILGLLMLKNPTDGVVAPRIVWAVGPAFVPKRARIRSATVDSAMRGYPARGKEKLNVGSIRGQFEVDAAKLKTGKMTVAVLTPAA